MSEISPTINDLSLRVGEIVRIRSTNVGLDPRSAIIFAVASGCDIALTLLEQSTEARFSGLSRESANRVINYFREEAARSVNVDRQVALIYETWAEFLEATYLK